MHYGPLPEIGQRIRVHHPHLEDGVEATVVRIERLDSRGLVGEIAKYGRHRVFLKDSVCDLDYYDTLGCSWEAV